MIKNRFINNTSWIIAGEVVKMIIQFFIGMLTARYLGPTNNGALSYVGTYLNFFTTIINLGLSSVIIYEFVNHKDEEGKILGTAITLRFVVGVISAVVFVGVLFFIEQGDKTLVFIALLQSIQLPFLCINTINHWYQYKLRSKYASIAQTIGYLVVSGYKVYLLASGKSVFWFAFSGTLDIIVVGALYYIFYTRHKENKLQFSARVSKRLLKVCYPFIIADLMVVIYGQIDKIMIKQMLKSTTEVGLYSAALMVCSIIGFIPVAILNSARPLIAEAKKENPEKYELRFRQLLAGLFWLCVLYSAFVMLFSRPIILLLFGEEYLGANMCLKIAVWYTTFSYIGGAKDFWLVCEEKKKYVYTLSALGALGNIILNALCIPIWGINGAAVATFTTQIFTNFILPAFFKETRAYAKIVAQAIIFKNINMPELIEMSKSLIRKKK